MLLYCLWAESCCLVLLAQWLQALVHWLVLELPVASIHMWQQNVSLQIEAVQFSKQGWFPVLDGSSGHYLLWIVSLAIVDDVLPRICKDLLGKPLWVCR
jgi:hypothetical protein